MFDRRMTSALAFGASLALMAACNDTGPNSPVSPSRQLALGQALGRCFNNIGLAGTQVAPAADGNVSITAPAGQVVSRVAVKAGTPCWFTPEGATGTYTISVQELPCYVVEGLGAESAHVTRIGNGPTCKDISVVEYITAPRPPDTTFLQVCLALEGLNPPPAALTFPFPFMVSGQSFTLVQGTCSEAMELPEGTVVIAEQTNDLLGIALWNATTSPDGRVLGVDFGAQTVTVSLVAGSTTVATIINLWVPDPGGDHIVMPASPKKGARPRAT